MARTGTNTMIVHLVFAITGVAAMMAALVMLIFIRGKYVIARWIAALLTIGLGTTLLVETLASFNRAEATEGLAALTSLSVASMATCISVHMLAITSLTRTSGRK